MKYDGLDAKTGNMKRLDDQGVFICCNLGVRQSCWRFQNRTRLLIGLLSTDGFCFDQPSNENHLYVIEASGTHARIHWPEPFS